MICQSYFRGFAEKNKNKNKKLKIQLDVRSFHLSVPFYLTFGIKVSGIFYPAWAVESSAYGDRSMGCEGQVCMHVRTNHSPSILSRRSHSVIARRIRIRSETCMFCSSLTFTHRERGTRNEEREEWRKACLTVYLPTQA